MTSSYDCAVIGGGIVGCATAAELARSGAKVVLLERERIGAGATWAAAGMLAPQSEAHEPSDWLRLLLAARSGYGQVADLLHGETGIDVEYRRTGVLRVALSEPERDELRDRARWQREQGLAVDWLEPREARALEPSLSPSAAGALWLPDEAQVHSRRLVRAAAALARRYGADVREGATATAVVHDHGRVRGVQTPAGLVIAGAVVLAAGAWSAFVDVPGERPPVSPVKGQIVSGFSSEGWRPAHIIWGPAGYVVPRAGGRILIGATEEPTFDARPTLGAIAGLVQSGSMLLPELACLPLAAAWAGLRPATPDRLPLIGPAGDAEGFFVAGGHYRNGVLLGPLTGKLMAQLVLGQPLDLDLSPYSPHRFERAATR